MDDQSVHCSFRWICGWVQQVSRWDRATRALGRSRCKLHASAAKTHSQGHMDLAPYSSQRFCNDADTDTAP